MIAATHTKRSQTVKRIAAIAAGSWGTRAPGGRGSPRQPASEHDPRGAYVTLNVRVPGEQPGAYAYKVVVQMPPDSRMSTPRTSPVGRCTKRSRTSRSHSRRRAARSTRRLGDHLGRRSLRARADRNGFFVQFPLSIAMPTAIAGRSLAFKTVEYYSSGQNAYWIGPPSANYPAPTVNIPRRAG